MIVKIQRSLFPPGAATMLIYNEDRTVFYQDRLSKAVKNLLGGSLKGYFHAHVDKDGLLRIGQRAPAQSW